ncbi:uncharacterized protein CPUR_08829 [Claviceps purpurea 20.1]|uniref:Uncharacterized protein n=1 Tax=Claviceps purpurea (strain 20.1) TaxID=1111077 RepID=M1WDM1_CLAP2|nr:uncharacterized protein CPUR_08829 [Claviceps purpurea 20.1]
MSCLRRATAATIGSGAVPTLKVRRDGSQIRKAEGKKDAEAQR